MTPEPRRSFLRRSVTTVGLTSLSSHDGLLFAQQDADKSQSVPEDATSITVQPQSSVPLTQIGTTEDWVIHRFRALTVKGETKGDLVRFLKFANHDVRIDGLSIDDAEQYWHDVRPTDSGIWVSQWELITPPRPEGTYEFSFTATFPSPITTRVSDSELKTWKGKYEYKGRYTIIGENSDKDELVADDLYPDCRFGSFAETILEENG